MTDGQLQSTSISVMLIVADADAAVAWYKDALGANELWNLGGVAGLEIGGVINRAIAAGAGPGSQLEDHQAPWGTHRQGGFRDPFGHHWSVGDRSPLGRHPH
jgi:PhnB protein